MQDLLKKLNFKSQKTAIILDAPTEQQNLLDTLGSEAQVITSLTDVSEITFGLFFVKQQSQIDELSTLLENKLTGDAVIWFAYPKGTSKKYTCDFNRDTGWSSLGKLSIEPVKQIAIDKDWTALRFRKVEYIKKLTRNDKMFLSEEGKQRKN